MSSRGWLNLALAGVVVALAWLALDGGDPPPPPSSLPVLTPQPGTVDVIRIASGAGTVTLTRDGDVWRVTEPYRAPADPHRVAVLLELTRATSEKGFRAAGNDLSQYGLEPAKARVAFDDRELLLGDTDPVEGLRYLLADDQVHLIPDRWFSPVFGSAEAWLDPRPLAGATDIETIVVPQARWRRGARGWTREPPDPRASADDGPRLADAWRHARALSVRPLDPGLPWSGTVRVGLRGDARERVFDVAISDDALWLGEPALQVQYRFLRRQGDALLGAAAAPE